jgi:hypothetical protein
MGCYHPSRVEALGVFSVYTPGSDHNELVIAATDGTHERTLWVGNQSSAETPHWGP